MTAPTRPGGAFRSRPTRHAGVREHGDWRIKWYEITLDGTPIAPPVVDAARRLVDDVCRNVPPTDGLGLGFVVVHHGAESVWLLLDRWEGDIVNQHTWSAGLDDPSAFTPVPPGGPTACVWELVVHSHERDALVRHILDPLDGPDADAYLGNVAAPEAPDATQRRVELIETFNRAWYAGDVDTLMALLSDAPVYRPSAPARPGFEYRGRDEVRAGFAAVMAAEQAAAVAAPGTANAVDARIEVHGDRAISYWRYGDVDGIDVWTFHGDRIAVKDAYRKA